MTISFGPRYSWFSTVCTARSIRLSSLSTGMMKDTPGRSSSSHSWERSMLTQLTCVLRIL